MIIKIGDRITFKSATRDGCKKATRIVNGFWKNNAPTVQYNGWSNFAVRLGEIIEVLPADKKGK